MVWGMTPAATHQRHIQLYSRHLQKRSVTGGQMLELALRDMSWQPPGNTKKQHTKTCKLNLTLNAAHATLHMHSNTARFQTYLFTQQSTYLSNLDVHSDGLLSSQEIVKLCIIATLSTEWATKRNTWCCSTVSQNHSEVAPNFPKRLNTYPGTSLSLILLRRIARTMRSSWIMPLATRLYIIC